MDKMYKRMEENSKRKFLERDKYDLTQEEQRLGVDGAITMSRGLKTEDGKSLSQRLTKHKNEKKKKCALLKKPLFKANFEMVGLVLSRNDCKKRCSQERAIFE